MKDFNFFGCVLWVTNSSISLWYRLTHICKGESMHSLWLTHVGKHKYRWTLQWSLPHCALSLRQEQINLKYQQSLKNNWPPCFLPAWPHHQSRQLENTYSPIHSISSSHVSTPDTSLVFFNTQTENQVHIKILEKKRIVEICEFVQYIKNIYYKLHQCTSKQAVWTCT